MGICRFVGAVGLVIALSARAQTPPPPAPGQAPSSDAPAAQPAAKPPAFEVVSVKPSKGDSEQMRIRMTPDGMSISDIPLHMILREAFNVSDDRLIGEPGWAKSARFDIEGKVAAEDVPALKNLKGTDRFAMLVPVFQERFGLKFHHETRELTVYALVIAKGGLKMKQADPNNTYPDGFRAPHGSSGAGMMRMAPGEFVGQGVPIDPLVRQLSQQIGGMVVDKTGLTGKFDFDLKWEPEFGGGPMMRPPEGGAASASTPPTTEGSGPSLFAALEEQLGLKLEARKEPVDVIVIDHVEQPTEN